LSSGLVAHPIPFCYDALGQARERIIRASDPPKRKHLNADQRRALKTAGVRRFIQQYGRKAQKGVEPNDRKYQHETQGAVRRMKPAELDEILREDET
jgi:hypothetical protein